MAYGRHARIQAILSSHTHIAIYSKNNGHVLGAQRHQFDFTIESNYATSILKAKCICELSPGESSIFKENLSGILYVAK